MFVIVNSVGLVRTRVGVVAFNRVRVCFSWTLSILIMPITVCFAVIYSLNAFKVVLICAYVCCKSFRICPSIWCNNYWLLLLIMPIQKGNEEAEEGIAADVAAHFHTHPRRVVMQVKTLIRKTRNWRIQWATWTWTRVHNNNNNNSNATVIQGRRANSTITNVVRKD